MTYSKDRAIDDKVKELLRAGWHIYRGSRHYRIEHPTTRFVLTVPGTPGDRRTTQNWMSQLRRAERMGFDSRMFYQGA